MLRLPALRVASVLMKVVVSSTPRLQRSREVVTSALSVGTFSRRFATGSPTQEEKRQSHYDSLVERKLFLETPFKMAASSKLCDVNVVDGGKRIEVTWDDGVTSRYHSLWLRHACHCPACRLSTNQTNVFFLNINLDTTIVSAEIEGTLKKCFDKGIKSIRIMTTSESIRLSIV